MGSLSLLAQVEAGAEAEEWEAEGEEAEEVVVVEEGEVTLAAVAAAPQRDFLMALMAFRRWDMAASAREGSVFISSEAE
jgi:predicted dithiol-disulfide oxidoreductase (DUF899 family)